MVPLVPHADRGKHAHRLFLADLESASPVMMWCGIPESGSAKVLWTKQHAGSLWATHAFAARISDECCPSSEVDIGHDWLFGGRVDQDRNVLFFRNCAHCLDRE